MGYIGFVTIRYLDTELYVLKKGILKYTLLEKKYSLYFLFMHIHIQVCIEVLLCLY